MEEPDPISVAVLPPEDESVEDRRTRILKETTAKQISKSIDDELRREQEHGMRQPKPIKILLLGQSESGKSTTLKNFQLMYELKAFRAERASWRGIIQLNVIRSIRMILDAVAHAALSHDNESDSSSSASSQDMVHPDTELLGLCMRLSSLRPIEDILTQRLALPGAADFGSTTSQRPMKEVAVNSMTGWKGVITRAQGEGRECFDIQHMVGWDDPEDPGTAINEQRNAMKRLWQNPAVHAILESQGIRLKESSGFFLDLLDEVTAHRYVPTDEHILRARLKTLGVSEHRMKIVEPNGGVSREFRIFDVGGQRSMRPAWVPYFDDMQAIIFVVPISAFDQTLEEDPTVNRLADSFALWTTIVSNKLLQTANLILFLNKSDIMQAKLSAGIRLSDHVPSYGLRPNDLDSASKYLRGQFNGILKESSPEHRMFYSHLTNAIDHKSIKHVLTGIKDMLLRFHLRESNLIL
ncbi:guanine nucleotide binding protein, alpha subunit [Mycena sp. CBHHK59/15]|nr:guanine nucleotide binding protein, alpha subunit [Mycena sp. CBHHK59/15]